ncbi:MAG: hypothetical protein J1E41_04435 [Ruminococcus sp.]|nr:hypothetical protein [Ruminococcus sp.]
MGFTVYLSVFIVFIISIATSLLILGAVKGKLLLILAGSILYVLVSVIVFCFLWFIVGM